MSRLALTRTKIYNTVARQLHGQVPCWVCGKHVTPEDATLEHIRPQSEGGSSHLENLRSATAPATGGAIFRRTGPEPSLFMAQGVYGIHAGSTAGRKVAEHHADAG